MDFEFTTANRIIFGQGRFKEIGNIAKSLGRKAKLGSKNLAVFLDQVEDAVVRNCTASEGTTTFLHFIGNKTQKYRTFGK